MKTTQFITNGEEYFSIKNLEEYIKFKETTLYKYFVDTIIKKLSKMNKKDLLVLKVFDFMESLDMNIENIKPVFGNMPFYKHFFDDVLNHLRDSVGETLFKENEFKSFEDIQKFLSETKNINSYYFDKDLINFTEHQVTQSKIYGDLFDIEFFKKILEIYTKTHKEEKW